MKKLLALIIIISPIVAHSSGFDESILWTSRLPAGSRSPISESPWRICRSDFSAGVSYSKPYNIDQLQWNTVYAKKGFGKWGISGRFSYFGLNRYYHDSDFALGLTCTLPGNILLTVKGNFSREVFNGVGDYSSGEIGSSADYKIRYLYAIAGVDRLLAKCDYKTRTVDFRRPWGAVSYFINEEISVSAAVKRFENRRVRWMFSQNSSLNNSFSLSFGVMSNPDVIFAGIVISHGSFSIDFAYYAVSRLDDTIVMGLGFGG